MKKKKMKMKPKGKSKAKPDKHDIVQLILKDHKPLKQLIKVMKDSEGDEQKEAFEEFAPLLTAHAKPEEQVLYEFMKEEEELRMEGFEGDVEHGLADQLVEEIKRTDDDDHCAARIKVLAELVEHHIEEEESELLPDFQKFCKSKEERAEMGELFLFLKQRLEDRGSDDAPSEQDVHEIRP